MARKEINFPPLYDSIEEFLDACGYDSEFINKFLEKVAKDDENPKDCPGW